LAEDDLGRTVIDSIDSLTVRDGDRNHFRGVPCMLILFWQRRSRAIALQIPKASLYDKLHPWFQLSISLIGYINECQ
jgi:hypothetical protein